MNWHVPEVTVHAYVDGTIADADAWSVEAHLAACEQCRRSVAEAHRAPDAVRHVWEAIKDELPPQGQVRPGTRRREAWVLAASGPAARLAWLAACAFTLIAAGVLAVAGPPEQSPWLAMLVPVVPVLGVAVSYGSGLDDAYEIIAAAPGGGLRLVLVRTAVVLGATTPVALVAGALAGLPSAVPPLAAAFGLTLGTLALGSMFGVGRAAAGVGVAWAAVAVTTAAAAGTTTVSALLTSDAMPAWLVLILAAAGVVLARREAFNELSPSTRFRIEA